MTLTENSCRCKWHPGISKISTPPEIAVEASWLLLPSLVYVLSGGTVQPENNYSCIIKVISEFWKSWQRISINTNHSYHQPSSPKPVSTDLTIKSDPVLTNPIGKDGKPRSGRCNKNIFPIRYFYCDTITRRVANQG